MNSVEFTTSNIATSNVTASNLTAASNVNGMTISTNNIQRISSAGALTNVTANANIITAGTLGVSTGGTGVSTLSSNKVLVGNGTGPMIQASNLHWDNTNFRLGVGVVPSEALHVVGNILASSNITAFSDGRLKRDLEVIPNATEKINQISGYTYFRSDTEDPKRHAGVIAQEVQKVLPEVVFEHDNGFMSVAYGNMVALLIESIKDLDSRVKKLEGAVNQ